MTVTISTPSGDYQLEPGKEITSQNPYIPPTTPVQKPTIEAEEGATVTLSKDGTTATIVVDKDATLKDVLPVSYTHLDVYKRQALENFRSLGSL